MEWDFAYIIMIMTKIINAYAMHINDNIILKTYNDNRIDIRYFYELIHQTKSLLNQENFFCNNVNVRIHS